MALQIGQIRKKGGTGSQTYMEDVPFSPSFVYTQGYSRGFKDFAITPLNNGGVFLPKNTYYLRFTVKRIPERTYQNTLGVVTTWEDPNNMDFSLILYKDAGTSTGVHTDGTYQTVESKFSVEPYKELVNEPEKSFEVVFTPNNSYKFLAFEMKKVSYDYIYGFRDTLNTSTLNFDDKGDLCVIKNILPIGSDKIGVQSQPGSLLCVNHEPIRIGRSGIYEVNNGVKISFVGVLAPNGSRDENVKDFILDYAWDNS